MLEFLLSAVGWLVAHTPEMLLRGLSVALGWAMYAGAAGRRRVMLQNLALVFPGRSAAWHRKVARESCHRMIETGLLALASPHLPLARIKKMATLEPRMISYLAEITARPRPVVVGAAHLAYWEALTWLPSFPDFPRIEASTVYRPLRNEAMNNWVVRTRGRFGTKLLSRKSGIHSAMHILQRNGLVNVLFDQNAGGHGSLTRFFGRNISMTELPALLVRKTGADLKLIGTRRIAFWRVEIILRDAPHDGTTAGILAALNVAFEDLLRSDESVCASWLWAHDRWKINQLPVEFKKISEKRNLLDEDARFRAATGRS